MNIKLNQTELVLLPERILYLPEFEVICIADWHLGKAAHFRKSGIPVPQPDLQREFDLIGRVLNRYPARNLFFLGDLFHSLINNDWGEFGRFVRQFPELGFNLIKGNHDIIPETYFAGLGIGVIQELVLDSRVILTHEPLYEKTPVGMLNIAGHIHPGYRIQLKARQGLTLPCYHYSNSTLLMPAFGSLTGLFPMQKVPGQVVYCILGEEVIAV